MAVTIRGRTLSLPILQGGMGIGVSLDRLAGAVAAKGGMGTISTAACGFQECMATGPGFHGYGSGRWAAARGLEGGGRPHGVGEWVGKRTHPPTIGSGITQGLSTGSCNGPSLAG